MGGETEISATQPAPLDELTSTLLAESGLGFVTFDPEGRVTWANAEVLARLGTVPIEWCRDALQALRTGRRIERQRDELRVLFVPQRGDERRRAVVAIVSEAAADLVSRHMNDRLVALGRIAAGVAHEVSNPLTYVYGNLELAIHELEAARDRDPTQKKRLQPILDLLGEAVDGAERIRNVLADIGLLARADTPTGRVDLREVVVGALRLVGNNIRKQATLEVELGASPFVAGTAPRLAQVVINLLTNALDALPPRPTEDSRISVTIARTGSHARLTVTDNGVGIPQSVLHRVFDPFFTTKPVGRGVGLGLTITHAIVTSLGGRVDITSEVNVGTTVTVLLPGIEPEVSA